MSLFEDLYIYIYIHIYMYICSHGLTIYVYTYTSHSPPPELFRHSWGALKNPALGRWDGSEGRLRKDVKQSLVKTQTQTCDCCDCCDCFDCCDCRDCYCFFCPFFLGCPLFGGIMLVDIIP